MRALIRTAAVPATMLATLGVAAAQGGAPEQPIEFALRPEPVRTTLPTLPRVSDPYRYPALSRGDRSGLPKLPISMQRRTLRFGTAPVPISTQSPSGLRSSARAFDARPRSRITNLQMEDSITLGPQIEASLGWRGVKVSNRNANATLGGGGDRLGAHDWFLPRGKLSYRPVADLTVSLGYRETMRAYDGAGSVGAMGLSRPQFDTLRTTLRPERTRQMQLDGVWQHDDLRVSIGGYRADLRDALSFNDYMPRNMLSATLSGMRMKVAHRLTPRLGWSVGYTQATGDRQLGAPMHERELAATGTWSGGGWRGSLAARRATGVQAALADARRGAVRVEAELGYAAAAIAGRPVDLAFRLTDPSPLASARLLDDGGALRAADRARALMFTATTSW